MGGGALERLNLLAGHWHTEGEVFAEGPAAGPAGCFRATDCYEWAPGGCFLVHRWDAQMPDGRSRGIEIIGYDAPRDRYFLHSYDDRGSVVAMQARLDDREWRVEGESMRFRGRFSADGAVLEGRWELCSDGGGAWHPWMKVRLARAERAGEADS